MIGTLIKIRINAKRPILLSLLLPACCQYNMAQRIAVKTNGLYWLTLSPNVGAELDGSQYHITQARMYDFDMGDTTLYSIMGI
jgi:hypothetical protein